VSSGPRPAWWAAGSCRRPLTVAFASPSPRRRRPPLGLALRRCLRAPASTSTPSRRENSLAAAASPLGTPLAQTVRVALHGCRRAALAAVLQRAAPRGPSRGRRRRGLRIRPVCRAAVASFGRRSTRPRRSPPRRHRGAATHARALQRASSGPTEVRELSERARDGSSLRWEGASLRAPTLALQRRACSRRHGTRATAARPVRRHGPAGRAAEGTPARAPPLARCHRPPNQGSAPSWCRCRPDLSPDAVGGDGGRPRRPLREGLAGTTAGWTAAARGIDVASRREPTTRGRDRFGKDVPRGTCSRLSARAPWPARGPAVEEPALEAVRSSTWNNSPGPWAHDSRLQGSARAAPGERRWG
jgi:hypothetical protein